MTILYEEVYESVKNWLKRVMIENSECIEFKTLDDTPDCFTVSMEKERYIAQINVSRPEFRPYRYAEFYVLDSNKDIHSEPVFVFQDSENDTVSDVIHGLNKGIDLIGEKMNLGETILDHYEKYLGEYAGADVYADEECEIQLLGFPETIKNCLVLATFGVSNYAECEVILPIDDLYDECAEIFANSILYALSNNIKIGRGVLIEGADNIVEGFSDKCGKTALCFTEAYPLPDEFAVIDNKCHIYMGFFVSKKEAEYIKVHGSERFEDILEEKEVDVINLNRSPVII